MTGGSPTGIDIVIPTWNGRDMLELCLSSLQAQSFQNFSVIVVDNGSSDGSVEFVHDRFPDVFVVELQENIGFSGAVNRGIAAGERDWVLLLNNDIEVEPRCLEHLAAAVESEPGTRMFALKMLCFDNRALLDGAGDGVLRGGVGYRLGTMESDSARYALKRPVFGACAGAALYHRSLFERIGMFDEDFFAYLEDVDFNMRAVRAGYTCTYIPDAVVYHVGSATTGSKINRLTVKLTTRNTIFVICKNYSVTMLLRFLPAMLVYHLFWLIFVVKKRQFNAYIEGFVDSFSNIRSMRRKGSAISRPTLSSSLFARRIIESEREVVASIMSRRREQGKQSTLLRWYLTIFC